MHDPSNASSDAPADARFYALVPCAGTGTRAGAAEPKQYRPLLGRAMVAHTLDALLGVARLQAVLVVLSPGDRAIAGAAGAFDPQRLWTAEAGGATRALTVQGGLAALRQRGARAHDWVLVHDAARCLVEPARVDRLIDACRDDAVGGLLALPVADTLKQATSDGRVAATLPRSDKWAAQTPQMFRLGALGEALQAAGSAVTDEASALEHQGLAPKLVAGDPANLKVTWPGDFAVAEALLARRERGREP
jgi:2-C-methyl-D-erythritol 4-phosphate cytidylyltransferase